MRHRTVRTIEANKYYMSARYARRKQEKPRVFGYWQIPYISQNKTKTIRFTKNRVICFLFLKMESLSVFLNTFNDRFHRITVRRDIHKANTVAEEKESERNRERERASHIRNQSNFQIIMIEFNITLNGNSIEIYRRWIEFVYAICILATCFGGSDRRLHWRYWMLMVNSFFSKIDTFLPIWRGYWHVTFRLHVLRYKRMNA